MKTKKEEFCLIVTDHGLHAKESSRLGEERTALDNLYEEFKREGETK